MKPLAPASARRFGRTSAWIDVHKTTMIAWVVAWAFFTYASALVRVVQLGQAKALAGIAGQVFAVADRVPPHAKIGFGLLLALLLMAFGWVLGTRRPALQGSLAGLGAALLMLCVAPFNYFDGTGGAFVLDHPAATPAHLLVGALTGVAFAYARRHWMARLGRVQ